MTAGGLQVAMTGGRGWVDDGRIHGTAAPATTGRRWREGEHEGGVWRAERRRRIMPSEGSVLASQIQRVLDRKFIGFFQIIPIFSNYTYPVSFTEPPGDALSQIFQIDVCYSIETIKINGIKI